MAADSKTEKTSGFFAKLKARLNRGTSWLSSDLLGLGAKPLDEATIEDLETRLLTADVGVSATEWLIDEMRREHRRAATQSAAETLAQTALGARQGRGTAQPRGWPSAVRDPRARRERHGQDHDGRQARASAQGHGPLGAPGGGRHVPRGRRRAAPGMGPARERAG